MKATKSERLLNLIVMLLETARPVSAEDIRVTIPGYGQENRETFKRMFERDKEELREMGIPLEVGPLDAWGDETGYRIPKDRYYLPELALTEEEIATLWLAAGLIRMRDQSSIRSALMKLSGDIPDEAASSAGMSADLALTIPNLPRAFEAVTERRRVAFSYRGRPEKKRVVKPFGLVHRRGFWYLVGADEETDQTRVFRLDRIEGTLRAVDPTSSGGEFDVPDGFRPEKALEVPPFLIGEESIRAKVAFDAGTAWWVGRTNPWLHISYEADGKGYAATDVSDVDAFISWLLSFGEGAEVVEPVELRARVRKRLEEIVG